MRMPWSRKAAVEPVDPHRPHAYKPGKDAGIGALAPIGGQVGPQQAALASAGAYTRTLGCAVPGCGRGPEDAIHSPADE